MGFKKIVIVWSIFTIGFIPLVNAESLLKNGGLTVAEDGKSISEWRMNPANSVIMNDTKDNPEGIGKSLKITINEIGKADGYISQAIYLKKGEVETFSISACMKSSSPRGGYLQVKLIQNKKELKRINVDYSKKNWEKYSKSFSSEGADKIEILCRWRLYDRYQGTSVWFGGIKLEKQGTTIALVGDSTVQNYDKSDTKRGWGQVFPELIKADVAVTNHAAGGRSTKTFRSEGRWKKVLESKPDFVLIQFGHNDSHDKSKPEATDANSEYKDLLHLYVKEARDAGITPILVTPPHRRLFKNGKMGTMLKSYAENMRVVATEMSVPCIDLYAFSEEKMTPLGPDGCVPLFCSTKDRSHFSEKGARMLAGYIAEELKKNEQTKGLIK